jgi:hypothetical protein
VLPVRVIYLNPGLIVAPTVLVEGVLRTGYRGEYFEAKRKAVAGKRAKSVRKDKNNDSTAKYYYDN